MKRLSVVAMLVFLAISTCVSASPTVVLNSPGDGSTNEYFYTAHNCSATGNGLVNVTLWTNHTGSWLDYQTLNATGNYTIIGFYPNSTTVLWNCEFCDVDGCSFAPANWTVTMDYIDHLPDVELITPPDDGIIYAGADYLYCSGLDDYNLTNVTLYSNETGAWGVMANVTLYEEYSLLIYGSVFTAGDEVVWNCEFCDNASQCTFAPDNYTLVVVEEPEESVIQSRLEDTGSSMGYYLFLINEPLMDIIISLALIGVLAMIIYAISDVLSGAFRKIRSGGVQI